VTPQFWHQLGLAFVVGGLWVALTTVVAEKRGTRMGGFIGGLPSTALLSLFFIGLTQTPPAAVQATTVMPLVQGINGIFILVFVLLAGRGLAAAVPLALIGWFLAAFFLFKWNIASLTLSLPGWLLLAGVSFLVLEKVLTLPSRLRMDIRHTVIQITLRALFGGLVISSAVLAAKVAGPGLGGILATFPAMFLSTLVITQRSGGPQFSRAVAKSLLVSGQIHVVVYAMAVRIFYPPLGIVSGTFAAAAICGVVGFLTYRFLRSNLS
jgi:uncharacterized membrane protein (GlpM family)